MALELAESFANALAEPVSSDRPTVITVCNVGNWKALQPAVQAAFRDIEFDVGVRHPVVFGGSSPVYLNKPGSAGAAQFKDNVRQVLEHRERIVVFDAQKIECLNSNPACIGDLIGPGQIAALYFRDSFHPAIGNYLFDCRDDVKWINREVSDDSLSIIATKISAMILSDEFASVARVVTQSERQVLDDMKCELLRSLAPDVEDNFLEGSSGVPKLREFARRKIASALLKATTPSFSVKSGRDCLDFYREELAAKFERHGLPSCYLSEISPNLSFVLKKQSKRLAEVRL